MNEGNESPEGTGPASAIRTAKQRLVALHKQAGLSYREIAKRLGLSESRVKEVAYREDRDGNLSGPSLVLLEQLEERAAKLAKERADKPAIQPGGSVASIAREAGVPYSALYRRLKTKGEPLEQATRPVRTWEKKAN